MNAMTHSYPVLIRESHLDTFGHVNNATYLQLFEEARWDLITQGGYGLAQIRESGLGPVILEVTMRFRKELLNRQNIRIETTPVDYTGKIGKLRQQILHSDGSLACEAEFTIGLWDTRTRKLVPPTPEWARAVGLDGSQKGSKS